MPVPHTENAFAAQLFDGIAGRYEAPARLLSFGQYDRWHRFLVSRLDIGRGSRLLDVATGTGLVAEQARRGLGCEVVGIDLSAEMLGRARLRSDGAGTGARADLLRGRAESLPFPDATFDAVAFTYLLRYVDDPAGTLRELTRVLRPGGTLASLEFAVPRGPILHPLWLAHTRLVMPMTGALLGRGWRRVGTFLGPSISAFYRRYPMSTLLDAWRDAGVPAVSVRRLSLGGAVVMWGRKEETG